MKKIWSISAIALYFYVATVLTGHGFISYFNIPQSFIDVSLRDNIIFFYQLITVYGSIFQATKWYVLMSYGFAAGAIWVLCSYSGRFKKLATILGTIFFFLYLGTFYYIGSGAAAIQTSFLVLSGDCISNTENYRYIVPVLTGDHVVLVPIDSDNKMINSFTIKDPKGLSCQFEYREIGKLVK